MLRLSYLIVSVLLTGSSHLVADILYSVADLETLGGRQSFAYALNGNGQVTGWSQTSLGFQHAFLYGNSQMVDLGTLEPDSPAPFSSYGYSINDAGQVVGVSGLSVGRFFGSAFLYSNAQMMVLGPLGVTNPASYAYGINNTGQVIVDRGGSAFVYSNGQLTELGTLGGFPSYAYGINDAGQVTGYFGTSTGATHASLYRDGQVLDLGTLGGMSSSGQAISNAGQVTGYSETSNGATHAFVYLGNGEITDLGTLPGLPNSYGFGVNDVGEVVGYSESSDPCCVDRAFLYRNGQMLDLNDLIDPALQITLSQARAINNRGQIVANAGDRAYLLTPTATPVPEPRTLTLFGLALLGLAGWTRHRWSVTYLPQGTSLLGRRRISGQELSRLGSASGTSYTSPSPEARRFLVRAVLFPRMLSSFQDSFVVQGRSRRKASYQHDRLGTNIRLTKPIGCETNTNPGTNERSHGIGWARQASELRCSLTYLRDVRGSTPISE